MTPIMADNYVSSAAKVVVAQLAEAAGFDAVHQSSLDTLADLLLRYINEVGSASHGYAELAGRTESNPLDVLLALNDLGVSFGELADYAKIQEEIPFAQSIASFPIKKKGTSVPTFQDKNEVPPSHIPNFLPAFPDKHTYINTPAFAGHEHDPHRRQQKEAQARQDAVRAVVKLQARMAPDNKLLEKRAPTPEAGVAAGRAVGAEAATAVAEVSRDVMGNPFLAPTLWENRLDSGSVSTLPQGVAAAAAAAAAAPTGGPVAAVDVPSGTAAADAVMAAAAELAGEWQQLAPDAAGQLVAGQPLFVSWDWKAHLQKKARLAVSGGEHADAYSTAVDATAGTKHGRRAKRTERALAAQLEIGDPTRRRVEEILAAQQEEGEGGGAAGTGRGEGVAGAGGEEEGGGQEQELI